MIWPAARRLVGAVWAPATAATAVGLCALLLVQQRHDDATVQRRDARADVVETAIRSIDADAGRAAATLDGALAVTADAAQLDAAIAGVVAPPSLVSAVAIVDETGTIVASNSGSPLLARAIAEAGGEIESPAPPTLVRAEADGERDQLLFATTSRVRAVTILIQLTIDRAAFEHLPTGTAFTVSVADPLVGHSIARTDAAVGESATTRRLTVGGQPVLLAVTGPDEAAGGTAWAAASLAALCAAALATTVRSAVRWRRERHALYHDDHLLDGVLSHQLRVEADLRVSETQLRAVFESTPDTVALLDPSQQRCRLLNRQALLGYEASLFEQNGFLLDIAGDDPEFRPWWSMLSSPLGATHDNIVFWASTADGQQRRLHLRVAALRGAGLGLQSRCVGVFTDVTEQHRQLEREGAMRNELERVRHLESVGRLAGGVAHDFRNVLAAVDINAELLSAHVEPDGRRHIDVIQRASNRAAEMVRQLLSFAQRELGQPITVDVNQALLDIETLLRSSVSAGVSIEFDLDARPCTTRTAPGDLDRVILNLVCNARDAMPLGGKIRITTLRGPCDVPRGSSPREWVRLMVTDNGMGIPDEIVDKVFDPYFTTKDGAGSGLGLASVHGIVSALGGHADITSTFGDGTTVTIALPLDERAATMVAPEPDHKGTRHSSPRQVVLVEDDDDVREPTALLLRERGFEVVEAATAYDAIAAVAENPPDVLVTDIVMAGAMNGLDLAEFCRGQFPDMAVLLVSAYAGALIEDGSAMPYRLLCKPFSSDELFDALDEICGVQHA